MKKLIGILMALCFIYVLPSYADLKRDSKSIDTENGYVSISGETCSAATFQLVEGMDWSGTVTFQATTNGNTWIAIPTTNVNSGASSTTATMAGIYTVPIGGYNKVRAIATTVTDGSITITGLCNGGLNAITLGGSGFATEATLNSIKGYVDQLEGYTDGLEGFVDGLEGSATTTATNTGTTATNVATVDGHVDQLEGYTDGLEGYVDGIESSLSTETTNTGNISTNTSNSATSLSVIDDWDESDRAKVNPIVGQAGVAAGSGTVSTTTQRVVLATDVGLPAGTSNIGNVGHGKTIKTVTGTVATDTDIIGAVASKRIKVIAIALTGVSATANTITFQSNASTALGTYIIQATASVTNGVAYATQAPSFLFATAAGEKLTLDVSAAANITYTVTYFDDDAS